MGGIIIGGFLFWKKKKTILEYVYIDTTGIESNPPKNYIDVEQNKTINFKLGVDSISICHLPIKLNIKYIEKIAYIWELINAESEYKSKSKIEDFSHKVRQGLYYKQATSLIYGLSKHFVDKKRRFKKALFKRSKQDTDFIMDITEQVFNFWLYRKKKALMLSQSQTLLSTVGSTSTWNSLNLDNQGKTLIKPRFANALVSGGSTTTKLKEKTKREKDNG
jgi:hypothetical protein